MLTFWRKKKQTIAETEYTERSHIFLLITYHKMSIRIYGYCQTLLIIIKRKKQENINYWKINWTLFESTLREEFSRDLKVSVDSDIRIIGAFCWFYNEPLDFQTPIESSHRDLLLKYLFGGRYLPGNCVYLFVDVRK